MQTCHCSCRLLWTAKDQESNACLIGLGCWDINLHWLQVVKTAKFLQSRLVDVSVEVPQKHLQDVLSPHVGVSVWRHGCRLGFEPIVADLAHIHTHTKDTKVNTLKTLEILKTPKDCMGP